MKHGLILVLLLLAGTVRAEPPVLGWPVDCGVEQGCRPVNYVDHDPSPERRDFGCGRLAMDDHKGVDFALPGIRAMAEGHWVLAAAPGTVRGVRDEVVDAQPFPKGKECGNGVLIDHGDGWTTQYCHLALASLQVRPGQRVKEGEVLGLVGLSGQTEYPHVHFQVAHKGTVVDPFLGEAPSPSTCGIGPKSLWNPALVKALAYQPIQFYRVGFATESPTKAKTRAGDYDTVAPVSTAPLVLWAEVFGLKTGDRLNLRLLGPDGQEWASSDTVMEKSNLTFFAFAGRKSPRPGRHHGLVRVVRAEGGEFETTREIEVK
ncbi:MAG: hypothetical protein A2516_09645 [Alphaproteobacteria bacterium RIFOXYD12_FULL_60_8]|nr:MAG: hypothetical protein A2516_09645 [Alphaproteobacteria bacterium RIFOXYD12_FULL_60_8]